MAAKLQWGILGTGSIARKFAQGLHESATGELAAVGSRAEGTLRKFLADFPARGHASYEALLADPGVQVVYISTPHPSHAEWAIAAARAGKHILCEKPLTMNAAEAEAVLAAAREHGVFLMEAFMYRCHPQTARVVELVRQGKLGAVRLVQATFSFRVGWDPRSRLLDPELGGGAILDIGCYCTSMARLVAGAQEGVPFAEPVEVRALGQIGQTGVDELSVALLKFPGGMLAQLAAGVRLGMENTVTLWGEEGKLHIPSPWVIAREGGESHLQLQRTGGAVEQIKIPARQGIYAMEADTVARHLTSSEAPAMSWEDTLGNMRTLDRWRAELGLRYAADGRG